MTNEEFNRKMEFIVWQQAQFSADMIEIREAHWRVERSLAQASDHLARATAILASTQSGKEELTNIWRSQRQTDRKFEELAESQKRTDEWLRQLDGCQHRTERDIE